MVGHLKRYLGKQKLFTEKAFKPSFKEDLKVLTQMKENKKSYFYAKTDGIH